MYLNIYTSVKGNVIISKPWIFTYPFAHSDICYRIMPRPAFILLPFPIICMMIFSLGMSYFLSTSMVFFKDTQFIWNVLSTVWLYATPIFYTENIITSPILLKAFHCNPMYQFIYFVRSILIDGVSPSPQHYLYCILLSVVPFILGFWFFKKNEDKFIFNL